VAAALDCALVAIRELRSAENRTPHNYASAAAVEHRGHRYVVTAFHALHGTTRLEFSERRFQRDSYPIDGPLFESRLFVDLGYDLAIVKIRDQMEQGRDYSLGTPATLYLPPGRMLVPKGTAAAAAGNPVEAPASVAVDVTNVAFSCLIADHSKVQTWLQAALADGYTGTGNSTVDGNTRRWALQRGRISQRLDDLDFLIAESMSISKGFSGGPIVITQDIVRGEGKLVGIVIGGNSSERASGRFAWATSSLAIADAIDLYERLLRSPTHATERPDVAGAFCVEFARIKAEPDGFLPVFKNAYAPGGEIYFIGGSNPRRSAEEVRNSAGRRVTSSFVCGRQIDEEQRLHPGVRFIFRNCTFEKTCLDNVILPGAEFIRCTFNNTQFRSAVLSGARFDFCVFNGYCQGFRPEPALRIGIVENGSSWWQLE
jgi:hypothetical protein